MKAFLIARVSTDDQADALPAQVYRLKDYAEKMEFQYEIFEIKESAYKGERQKFNEVLSRLFKYDELIALVFDKVDRYSRDSSSEEVRLLNSLTEAGKIELHFSSDHLIITKESSAGQKLMLTMNTAFSQYYSNAISDNVKRRNEQLRRDGIWTGRAPVGYLNTVKDGRKWIETDPILSPAIKDGFKMYASGLSTLGEIKKYWESKYGFTTSVSSVDKILKNPFYIGIMRILGREYEHNYDKLISKELFEKVDSVRKGYKIQPHRWAGLPFAYRSLITCKECGCRVTFEIKKKKYIYGHCTQAKGKHNAKYVSEHDLTRQLLNIISQVAVPEIEAERILLRLKASYRDAQKDISSKKLAIRSEITKYENRSSRLYDDYLDGRVEEKFYLRKSKEYSETIKNLYTQLEAFELLPNDRLSTVSDLLKLSRNASKIFEVGDYIEKRKILKKLLSNLELEDKQLRWKYKKPYDTMAFCNNNSTWQGH